MSAKLIDRLRGKRVGVVLSAGYFGFYGHAGFVDAFRTSGLEAAAWSGTSAGGMIAAFASAGVPSSRVIELLLQRTRDDFWDPSWFEIIKGAVTKGTRPSGLLDGSRFRTLLDDFLPVKQFDALPTPLVLVATNLSTQAPLVIRSGDVPSAIHATCAYPGLFQAVRREEHLLWDGGIVDKAPALVLSEAQGERLDALLVHFLPSRDGAKEPVGPFAYASGMASGFAAIRKDHFRLQLELLRARGVEVHVVTSRLPPVSPKEMHRGVEAIDAGRASLLAALERPSAGWTGED
jgi:NTE family protein